MFVLLVTGAAKRVGLRGFYFGLEKPGGGSVILVS